MNVLIVDDDRLYLILLKDFIEKISPCKAECFTDPIGAFAWCRTNDLVLLLIDYMMPEMDGLEFIRHFRALPGKDQIPVVMITSAEEVKVRQDALKLGANDFLCKPIDKSELTARMRNMLSLRQSQKMPAAEKSAYESLETPVQNP